MKEKPKFAYCVISDAGNPMELFSYDQLQPVLVTGLYGALFKTRRQAELAIAATAGYAATQDPPLKWPTREFRIYKIKLPDRA